MTLSDKISLLANGIFWGYLLTSFIQKIGEPIEADVVTWGQLFNVFLVLTAVIFSAITIYRIFKKE